MRVPRGGPFRRARAARRARRTGPASVRRQLLRACGRTNSHAPMFSGSSCTQTTSSSVRIAVEHRAQVAHRETDRAARARQIATSVGLRRACSLGHQIDVRPCRCRGSRAAPRPRALAPRRRRSPAASGLRRARAASRRPAGGAAGSSASGRPAAAGRCASSAACRRSRWKYCAAVVQLATRRLMSAASCRKRSRRALE